MVFDVRALDSGIGVEELGRRLGQSLLFYRASCLFFGAELLGAGVASGRPSAPLSGRDIFNAVACFQVRVGQHRRLSRIYLLVVLLGG